MRGKAERERTRCLRRASMSSRLRDLSLLLTESTEAEGRDDTHQFLDTGRRPETKSVEVLL
jgi:hypothetical protein